MREMTAREYFRQMVRKEAERIAAKEGVRIVAERPKPQLIRDANNVVGLEPKRVEEERT